jgi:hypothetical protein
MNEPLAPTSGAVALNDRQSAILDLVLDMIVPPGADGQLPGASAVGVPAYLMARATDAMPLIGAELDALDAQARALYSIDFCALAPAVRQALVNEIRTRDPGFMSRLALETVTCYYQNARVLEALSLETHPPYPQGFQVIAGDLGLLSPVRRRGKLYRDA